MNSDDIKMIFGVIIAFMMLVLSLSIIATVIGLWEFEAKIRILKESGLDAELIKQVAEALGGAR